MKIPESKRLGMFGNRLALSCKAAMGMVLVLMMALLAALPVYGQSHRFQIEVVDGVDNRAVEYAKVTVTLGNESVFGGFTNEEGTIQFKSLASDPHGGLF